MYNFYHSSIPCVINYKDGSILNTVLENNKIVEIYNQVEQCILSTYNSWLQGVWSNIIKEENIRGYSCLHNNILYFDVAKSLVWDVMLLKLHIPTATNEDILNYFNIKDKALFLNTIGVDLFKMIDCILNYDTFTYENITLNYFIYTNTLGVPPTIPTSSNDINNLIKYPNPSNGNVYTITLPNQSTGVVFWIPDDLQDITSITSPLSGDILNLFTVDTIEIDMGDYLVSYKQYSFIFLIPLNNSQTFTITI